MEELDLNDIVVSEVRINGILKDGKQYVLRGASGDAAIKYRNAVLNKMTLEDGKVSKLSGMADTEKLLVSLCLFEVSGSKETPVSQEKLGSWPNEIFKKLFEKTKEISHLEEGLSSEQKAFNEVLSRPDSPVSLNDFKKWLTSQEGESIKLLRRFFEIPEETTKNSSRGTEDG